MDKYKYRKYRVFIWLCWYSYSEPILYFPKKQYSRERNTRPIWVICRIGIIIKKTQQPNGVSAYLLWTDIPILPCSIYGMALYLCGIIVQWRSMRANFEWVELVNGWLYARQHRVVFFIIKYRIRIVRNSIPFVYHLVTWRLRHNTYIDRVIINFSFVVNVVGRFLNNSGTWNT